MNYYQNLKTKIDRPYNVGDINILLKRQVEKSECYTVEFQQWFVDGLGKCEKHNYTYLWHKSIDEECPKCKL